MHFKITVLEAPVSVVKSMTYPCIEPCMYIPSESFLVNLRDLITTPPCGVVWHLLSKQASLWSPETFCSSLNIVLMS